MYHVPADQADLALLCLVASDPVHQAAHDLSEGLQGLPHLEWFRT